ncbi:alpha/beta-hydrolase [Periconia macrospinosa]|uniref:Alpha/beta-hydrolase n=1 Tax=Periconia macrospinosa TaxID=97972 RepID=A0A2V1DLQ2_9PLEO|nr:alpha/beta-hydrolase [Periconia macrospinosa]
MKLTTCATLLLTSLHVGAQAPPTAGTGPYKSIYYEDPTLPEHTIFMPAKPPSGVKMPVVLWGNGQCYGDGLAYGGFLSQVASYGIVVIANGWVSTSSKNKYQGDITKDLKYLTDSITWIQGKAGQDGNFSTVDAAALGVAGHSCGGYQTVEMRKDSRVKMLAPFGYFTEQSQWATDIKVPVGAFVGEYDTSIALPQLRAGWPLLPASTPGWWGTYPGLDHGGSFDQENGGVWAVTLARWILFTLTGDEESTQYFKGDGADQAGWNPITKQKLDSVTAP